MALKQGQDQSKGNEGKGSDEGKGKSPPAPVQDADVAHAHNQAAFIRFLVEGEKLQHTKLLEAKETADPVAIRAAAIKLEPTQLMLEVAARTIMYSDQLDGGHAPELVDARELAIRIAQKIVLDVATARGQADALERAKSGALSEVVADGDATMTPAQIRLRAAKNAPPGLCDDKELQRPDSPVCPLDDTLRTSNRNLVTNNLTTIAEHWQKAIDDSQLKEALAEVTKNHGLHPLLEMLLDSVTAFVGGQATSALLRHAEKETVGLTALAKLPAASHVMLPIAGPQGVTKLMKNKASTISGLGKKLTDRALKAVAADDPNAPKDLHAKLTQVASAWREGALNDVIHLTDPDLVIVGERLANSPFNYTYFAGKVTALVAAYRPISELGQEDWSSAPLRLAWVTSPSKPARLATYRNRTCNNIEGPRSCLTEAAYAYAQGDARLAFDEWVDPSMYKLAIAREPDPIRIDASDARWATAPTQWTAIPHDKGIQMFGMRPTKDLQ